ncbi:MAG: hypothetical protein IPK63_23580 [Candidatus Competibacteraceae bacterium]|nr:hypothetical protein [Candidatus Competibacteraceae bacterium]
MKLTIPKISLDIQLLEFDVWITPSLGEIRDTEKFKEQMEAVVNTFEAIGSVTDKFKDVKDCHPIAIADTFIDLTRGKTEEEAGTILGALASVLYLVTGKSDNNAKCQLPLFLRDKARWDTFPVIRRRKEAVSLASGPIPRELKAEKYLGLVAALRTHPDHQKRLLEQFVSFLLNDDACVSQLWSIGYSYFMLKGFKKERDLLTPLVVFQVRGSVAASGGHDPEELLRTRLAEWGLQAGVDYNTSDVVLTEVLKLLGTTPVVEEVQAEPADDDDEEREKKVEVTQEEEGKVKVKTRAYDFILPYQVSGWKPKVFIQSQFYAGDSGSVSHKNVDQTSTSRKTVQDILANARFVEYVDGAGYFSTLNRDLKHLLNMTNTASFIQVRSAAVRLRRELQHVGFLTPLEVEHAIFRSDGSPAAVRKVLKDEGYADVEIERSIGDCARRGLVVTDRGKLTVTATRRDVARRYLLLDVAARLGAAPATPSEKLAGCLLVPGYGPFHGIKLDQLVTEAIRVAPSLKGDLDQSQIMLADIRWLCEQELAMSS